MPVRQSALLARRRSAGAIRRTPRLTHSAPMPLGPVQLMAAEGVQVHQVSRRTGSAQESPAPRPRGAAHWGAKARERVADKPGERRSTAPVSLLTCIAADRARAGRPGQWRCPSAAQSKLARAGPPGCRVTRCPIARAAPRSGGLDGGMLHRRDTSRAGRPCMAPTRAEQAPGCWLSVPPEVNRITRPWSARPQRALKDARAAAASAPARPPSPERIQRRRDCKTPPAWHRVHGLDHAAAWAAWWRCCPGMPAEPLPLFAYAPSFHTP